MSNSETKVLLVEGEDDLHVITHLVEKRQRNLSFYIKEKGGFDPLRKSIYGELNEPDRQVLGIVADANSSPPDRWLSIVNELNRAGCSLPTEIQRQPVIFNGPRIHQKVGIWLMPNNQERGQLENFVVNMIPDDDVVWPLAQRYIEEIPLANREFDPSKTVRAYIHAWLAARREPRKMGAAIGRGDLDENSQLAVRFVDWLTALFEL